VIIIGLTGSIGMGKSTTAAMFAKHGIPVHDADAVVHDLYASEAVPLVEAAFPGVTLDGAIDRAILAAKVIGRPEALEKLEAIVHPLVRERERRFLSEARARDEDFAVLEIPLLFETGAEDRCDVVVVVTSPPDVQRGRVLARPGMTPEKFQSIVSKQIPDSEKRAKADFIVETHCGMEHAQMQVNDILATLRARL
jgi:dephospho-CoA kinase